MKVRVCVITGTRADFGLLRGIMEELEEHPKLSLETVATGMHLNPEFGRTLREIEEAGFTIDYKVDMLIGSDSIEAVTKSIGLGVIGFADAFSNLSPNLILVLGDRFEIFAATTAAMIRGIPVAHIHGGESSEGAFDETLRHCITKMSHLHFVAAEEYRKRVIQLGEIPENVFNVGGMGVDALNKIKLLSRKELEKALNLKFWKRNLLITYHPVTIEGSDNSIEQMTELLSALEYFHDVNLIFTMPNADTGGLELNSLVKQFVRKNSNSNLFSSLGQLKYFSCLSFVDGVIGNSSSGLLEAPSFKIGTVNIGERQKGRLKAKSVIDCPPEKDKIKKAIQYLYEARFANVLKSVSNPYGEGGASKAIVNKLANIPLKGIVKKSFYDLDF